MDRNVKTILAATVLYQAGLAAYYNFFSVYIYQISGESNFAIALFAALAFAAYALTSRFWGAVSDFYAARKPFIVYGMLAMGLLTLLFLPAMNSAAWIIAASIPVSMANAVFVPATLAAITHKTENSGAALGMLDGASSLGWGAGSVAMGFLANFAKYSMNGNFHMIIILSSACLLAGALIIWKFFERQKLQRKGEKLLSAVASVYKFSSSGNRLILLYLAVFLGWFALFWYLPLIKLQLFEGVSDDNWIMYGLAHAAASFTSIFASPIAGKISDRVGGMRMLAAALVAYMLYIPAVVLTQSKAVFIILWMLPIWSFFSVGIYSTGARLSKLENRGETMGTLESCREIAGTIAPIPGGRVADSFGRTASMLFAPAFLAGALVVMGILGRKGKEKTQSR